MPSLRVACWNTKPQVKQLCDAASLGACSGTAGGIERLHARQSVLPGQERTLALSYHRCQPVMALMVDEDKNMVCNQACCFQHCVAWSIHAMLASFASTSYHVGWSTSPVRSVVEQSHVGCRGLVLKGAPLEAVHSVSYPNQKSSRNGCLPGTA